ncbi:hypothetical protein FDW83_08860 [Pseudarthrobacter sp. NamE2]|uniref:hypothetical protein n=1 Tax=Pseudarthrobacter sp. NamE2 TaxID=2576838 RepID=UPI0010FE5F15|nr:hypothetical protein [Pseudarthrobacter sp. NamE2]TLM83568.1 hypothetical protein FDW83_08860 [Pseudarthrobacter sp. NamE2]
MPFRIFFDEAPAPRSIHPQPQDVPVLCHVLHPAPIENLSLFVDLDMLADKQGPVVFGLPRT